MNTKNNVETHFSEFPEIGRISHSDCKHICPKGYRSKWHVNRFLVERAALHPLSIHKDSSPRTVRCIEGEIELIFADLRPDSPAFGHWGSVSAVAAAGQTWIAPKGFAVGWQVVSEYALVEQGGSNSHFFIEPDDADCDVDWSLPLANLVGISDSSASEDYACLGPITIDWWADFQAYEELGKDQELAPEPQIVPDSRSEEFAAIVEQGQRGRIEAPQKTQHQRITRKQTSHSDKPTILVIGSSGQLGKDLCKHFRRIGRVIGACKDPSPASVLPLPTAIDLGRPASIRDVIRRTRPTLIVNAAAMTNVDAAEASPREAQSINANAPAIMAEEATHVGASMLHFCSDKVYAGTGERPWKETDDAAPTNQYGLTKLRGSQAVLAAACPSLVIRTGWLYSAHGNNFVQNLIDLMTYRRTIALADDYFGAPTSTDWLAKQIVDMLSDPMQDGALDKWLSKAGGLYHLSGLGFASRLEVADFVASLCRQHCVPIVTERFNGKSLDELSAIESPRNCRLDISKYTTTFRIQPPSWQDEMARQVGLLVGATDAQLLSIA